MRIKVLTIATLGLLLPSAFASAEGLKGSDGYRDYLDRSRWTGFYAGVHLGYQSGEFSGLMPAEPLGGLGNTLFTIVDPIFQGIAPFGAVDPLSIFAQRTASYDGWVGGAHFGYDYQRGPLVFGVYASASSTGTRYSETADLSTSINVINILPIATIDVAATGISSFEKDFEGRLGGRVGVAMNQFLFYGLGGVAMAHTKYELNNTLGLNIAALAPVVGSASATLTTRASDSHVNVGYFFGLGAEVMLSKSWSLGAEWQRTSYAAASYRTQTSLNVTASAALNLVGTQVNLAVPGQTRIKIDDENDLRVKLNYRF